MRLLTTILVLILSTNLLTAQLSRYPNIQSTSQTSTIIAWKTDDVVIGNVYYGTDSANLNNHVTENLSGKRHAVTLKNLDVNTKYYYTVYSNNTPMASEYFYTAKDSTSQNFSFIQYGDCGYNNSEQHTIGDLMEADDAEFAVVCGDVDQGGVPHVSGSEGGDNYDDIFFNVYNDGVNSKMLSRECHYPAIGNHDTYANNGATYEAEFYLPYNNADSTERYYSFTWGDAKFISLDVITPFDPTTFPVNQLPIDQRWWTDFRQGSAQYQFLEDELKCNDKKWVFVYFHEGPWTNYWGPDYNIPSALGGDYYQYEGNTMVRQHLVPLFEQYDVDFVLVGHSHLYEQAFKNDVWYITSGGAGSVSGNTQYGNNPEILKSMIDNLYIKFNVDSNTVSYDVINDNNTVIDTFSLTKNYTKFKPNPSITNVSCFGANDGAVTLNIAGPKPPYTVEWFDGNTDLSRTNLSGGTHYAYVRNAYGCEKVIEVEIEEPAPVQVAIESDNSDFTYCENDSILLFADSEFETFNWSNGETTDSIYVSNSGNISLSATDSNGCTANSQAVNISESLVPTASFGFANNEAIYNFLSNSSNVTTYYWDFGDGNLDTSTTNLTTHLYTANGDYDVTLIVENDCSTDTITKTITIYTYTGINSVFVENAITIYPNPIKDKATIEIKGLGKKLKYELYNTKGELVKQEKLNKNNTVLSKDNLSAGIYFIKVSNAKNEFSVSEIIIE